MKTNLLEIHAMMNKSFIFLFLSSQYLIGQILTKNHTNKDTLYVSFKEKKNNYKQIVPLTSKGGISQEINLYTYNLKHINRYIGFSTKNYNRNGGKWLEVKDKILSKNKSSFLKANKKNILKYKMLKNLNIIEFGGLVSRIQYAKVYLFDKREIEGNKVKLRKVNLMHNVPREQ